MLTARKCHKWLKSVTLTYEKNMIYSSYLKHLIESLRFLASLCSLARAFQQPKFLEISYTVSSNSRHCLFFLFI